MELLSPDAADRPWAGGPAVTALVTDNRGTSILGHILPSVSAYGKMTEAVQELLGTLGKPLDDTDALAEHYAVFRHPCPVDGILLTLTYPNLQELRNTEGELLDQAKWVGLEWARSEGKPNRLFYGTKPYDIEGIYQLNGAMTHLEECLNLDLGME